MQEASTPSEVEPVFHVSKKRTYQHIDDYNNLKLIQAVNLGLNITTASRMAEMSVSNAQLVMKKYEPMKRKKHDP